MKRQGRGRAQSRWNENLPCSPARRGAGTRSRCRPAGPAAHEGSTFLAQLPGLCRQERPPRAVGEAPCRLAARCGEGQWEEGVPSLPRAGPRALGIPSRPPTHACLQGEAPLCVLAQPPECERAVRSVVARLPGWVGVWRADGRTDDEWTGGGWPVAGGGVRGRQEPGCPLGLGVGPGTQRAGASVSEELLGAGGVAAGARWPWGKAPGTGTEARWRGDRQQAQGCVPSAGARAGRQVCGGSGKPWG